MTNKIYTIAVEVANEPTAVVSLNAARTAAQGPLKLIAKSGALYQLTEAATGFAPQQIQVRRKGKDLHISLEQNHPDRPDLVIENYFGVDNAVVVGQAENGQHYPFIPDTARDIHAIDKLADGTTITQVLGGQMGPVPAAVAAAEPIGATEASGAAVGALLPFNPLLAGGAAAAAAAAGGGGGGTGGGGGGTTPTAQITTFDNNGQINKSEQGNVPVSGTTTNAAGGNVELVITDKDGKEVTRKTVPVDAQGNWSTTVDVTAAAEGKLTASAVAANTAGVKSTGVSKDATKDTVMDPNPVNPSDPNNPNEPTGNNDWTAKLDPASDTGTKGDSTTANNRPTFSGTGEPGGKVEITLPDGSKVSATVNPNGTWSAPYPATAPALPNGANNLPIKVTDPAGNTQNGTLPVTIVGPTVDIQVFDGSVTAPANFITGSEQSSVTLSGTSTNAPQGSVVTIVVSGTSGTPVTVTATVQANGNWSTTADLTSLPQGALTASATVATTVDGITITSRPDTQGSTKDTVIDPNPVNPSDPSDPNAPKGNDDWTARIDPASDTGTKGDSTTANNRPTFSGTGEPNGKVEITLPDGTKVTATVNPDGTWSAPYPAAAPALPNGGPQNLPVSITDPAGNTQAGNLPITIVAPSVDVTVFDGSVANPANVINAAEQGSVTLSGTTSNTNTGDIVTIVVSGTFGTPVTVTATVQAGGAWSTTADLTSLPQGVLTARATVATTVDGSTITSRPDTQDTTKDSIGHRVVITHNANALDGSSSITGSKDDDKLNIAEAKNGVTYTLTFDTAVDTLSATDLDISGGTLRGTPTANATKTVWTLVLDPTPSNTGSLDLRLKNTKLATLTDAAGNPAEVTNASLVSHDTVAPLATFSDTRSTDPTFNTGNSTDLVLDTKRIFVLDGNEAAANYTIGLNSTDTISQVSFEGAGSASLPNQSTVTLNQTALAALAEGFYSLEVRTVDDAGNTSVSQQIIGKNTATFPATNFVSTLGAGNSLTGDNNNNFFINRSGVHESMTLGGAADRDTVFVLKTGLGTVGAADQLTINDFNTGAGMDRLRLDDLFSGSATHNQIRFEGLDLDNNGTLESTRMYVNTAGGLNGASLADTAEQIITLVNVVAPTQSLLDPNAAIARPDWLIL